jgi:hypothetical protein
MDPYLERPAYWPDVHHWLISHIATALQPQLRPRYVARVEVRVFLEPIARERYPDVHIAAVPLPASLPLAPGGGVAVAERAPAVALSAPLWVPSPKLREARQAFLQIRDVENREVVTVIEVLSPWNKAAGPGRDEYLAKQHEVLRSATNLVEIDLLRRGAHTVAAPEEEMLALGPADYLVCIHRAREENGFWVYRCTVREPLPTIPIPLRGEDEDVPLALQEVLDRTYDAGAYDLVLDYTEEPDPPLSRADALWADQLLRARGLREAEGKAAEW